MDSLLVAHPAAIRLNTCSLRRYEEKLAFLWLPVADWLDLARHGWVVVGCVMSITKLGSTLLCSAEGRLQKALYHLVP